ncbi:MAG TPA: EAL domain-containing protein [Longimicrobiales bacterium]|nr:EAL domain-containing protein [Longimicrobiales bacterium]
MHETEPGSSRVGPVGALPLSGDDARRLLHTTAVREAFDRLIRVVGTALRSPVAILGVIEDDSMTVVSQHGVPERWRRAGVLPLSATFCRHVQASGTALSVEDASLHPVGQVVEQLEDFPRAAYAGTPVVVGGEVVAVLSVADERPRRWSVADASLLRDLADTAARELELMARPAPTTGPAVRAASAPPALTLPDGLLAVDGRWRITWSNDRAQSLLRLPGETSAQSLWELFPGLVGSAFHRECQRSMVQRQPCEVEDYCHSAGAWLEVRSWPTDDGGAALQLRDVSGRRAAQEALRGREARYRRLFEESRTPLFVMAADGMLLEANHALAQLLGRGRDELLRRRLGQFAADPDAFDGMIAELQAQGTVGEVEIAFTDASGAELSCMVSVTAQPSVGGAVYHGSLRDNTAQKRAQEELVRTAFQDPLTQLPNRLVFMDRLERLLQQHSRRRPAHGFAVVFLDLDNFKQINDTLGHLAGDQLLVSVARRLETCIRQEDTVARIGGDEFALLLDMVQDVTSVTIVLDRIRDALAEPFRAEGRRAGTSASMGVAICMTNYDEAEDLLRDADTAMYRAKASGRDRYVLFDGEMHERSVAQRQLEAELRGAVARQQLAVHYHPVVQLDTGSVTGMEALLRWAHPQRGILLPAEFMPLAEQTGLIVELGWWVLREACRQMRAWHDEFPDTALRLTMSVNLSARQFVHPELVTRIDEILEETGLDPACLRLDLTEAVVMQNAELATRLLGELRERGIRICLDDFGTGYSSLPQLRELPISGIKIDSSFVRRLNTGDEGREVVQSIIALGRSMAIDAIAEGVETPEQLDELRRLGTRFAQGFLFSLPLDHTAAGALLKESGSH